MGRTSKNILYISMIPGIVSITYFFSLILSLPLVLTTVLIATLCTGTYIHLNREKEAEAGMSTLRSKLISYAVILLGFYMLVCGAYHEADKYGDWDAWWFWNYHAKFLARPDLWMEAYETPYPGLLSSRVSHSDYPLLLPATVGYFWRLFSTESNLIPFAVGFVFTCLIPLLIFFETYRKNIVVAAILFLFIANHTQFVNVGVSQMADIVLAFFFLGVFVAIHHYRQTGRLVYLTYCGIMLGACIWVKNEGAMLSLVFVVFMIRDLFSLKNFTRLLAGLVPLLLAYLVFKIGYAPANDIIEGQGESSLSRLTEVARYSMVFEGVKRSLDTSYPEMKALLLFYLAICAIQKDIHVRYLSIIVVCLVGYHVVYVLSPHDLEWHLNTSIDRVLLHLIPATIYVTSLKLGDLRLRG